MQALYPPAEAYTRREEYEQAYLAAARQAALDPCREEAHRQMMRALALSGPAGWSTWPRSPPRSGRRPTG